jgi:hypothetical protein
MEPLPPLHLEVGAVSSPSKRLLRIELPVYYFSGFLKRSCTVIQFMYKWQISLSH